MKLHPSCWIFGDCSPTGDTYESFVTDHKLQKDNKAFDAGAAVAKVGSFLWGWGGVFRSLGTKLLSGTVKESPWSLPANQRGFKIEDDIFGGSNLPNNFPTIDYWNASTGAAVSYKSIDTTAKSYQKLSKLKWQANDFVKKMEGFNGATYSGTTVDGAQIQSRGLKIAVPAATTPEQWGVLNKVASDAASKGVNVTIHEVE
ncbi:endonuclease toxin domain-containing protein [Streptomyces sp. NPDC054829]